MRPASGQFRGDDLTGVRIDSEVQLAPSPVPGWLLQLSHVNPEPRAVDEQMDGSIGGELPELEAAELLKPSGQGRVIRDRETQLEEPGQRPEEAFGLAEWKVEDHADRQRGLDGNVRVGALAAGLLAGARQASSASSESQTVTSPRRRRPASYSGQFRTRY